MPFSSSFFRGLVHVLRRLAWKLDDLHIAGPGIVQHRDFTLWTLITSRVMVNPSASPILHGGSAGAPVCSWGRASGPRHPRSTCPWSFVIDLQDLVAGGDPGPVGRRVLDGRNDRELLVLDADLDPHALELALMSC